MKKIPIKLTPTGSFVGNKIFEKDQKFYSADKRYFFTMQSDGNFVIYKFTQGRRITAIWHTHTNGKAIERCVFQKDGNLVLYDYTGKAQWNAWADQINRNEAELGFLEFPPARKEYPKVPEPILVMQNDGNLVIYKDNWVPWSSDTYEKN